MSNEKKQQTRSLLTRAKLIEGTLDVIYEVGFKSATTERFAAKAGVSRGAMLHHFPTREDIIAAAMEHLLQSGTEEIRAKVSEVNAGTVSMDDLIDFIWRLYSGRFFYLSLEMVVEARSNALFRMKMVPVLKEFHSALDTIWRSLIGQDAHRARRAVVILNLTVCLLRGMGVQTVLRSDNTYYEEMIEMWKQVLPSLLSNTMEASLHVHKDAE